MKNSYSEKMEAYQEAKNICAQYINYSGDKRRSYYKRLAYIVSDMYIGRMNNFAKELDLPNYVDTFFK